MTAASCDPEARLYRTCVGAAVVGFTGAWERAEYGLRGDAELPLGARGRGLTDELEAFVDNCLGEMISTAGRSPTFSTPTTSPPWMICNSSSATRTLRRGWAQPDG